ncbi:hypothetical protein [Achromobacter spanius]|uniref:hypothetical protein n=1 Tax=Achromobacter spanius TaxID=217203 RepID=UPI0038270448
MASITPLGKALSQNPLPSADAPLSAPISTTVEQPISAFQWVSLAKATWTWVLRPLWYLCFKWPTQLLFPQGSRRSSADEWRERNEQEAWRNSPTNPFRGNP